MIKRSLGFVALCCLVLGCEPTGGSDEEDTNEVEETVDPCALVQNPCAAAGSRCDGETLVACVEDVNGCLVESRVVCEGTCEGDPSECRSTVDCSTVANSCTAAGQVCEADVLVICARDAQGCLVETRTDCTLDGNVCDAATSACTGGPCEDTCFPDIGGGPGERACVDGTSYTPESIAQVHLNPET